MLLGCNSLKKNRNKDNSKELLQLMSGSFSSAKQARNDTAYYNIKLEMHPIWVNRKNEQWLYVEQAVAKAPNRPYRQRIYQLVRVNEDLYQSIVYTLPNPKAFVGQWKKPAAFDSLSPDNLERREGCDVYLRKVADKYYRGATKEGTCKSNLEGASFATSEVEIFADKVISWDRGFDEKGIQVWGAAKGGYIFDRIEK